MTLFPMLVETIGIKTTDILEVAILGPASLGFAVSLIAGILLLRGTGRTPSIAAFGCGLLPWR